MSEIALQAAPHVGHQPYIGLMPYAEKDAPLFFGREAEREIITANLIASRLTLLYGASGVGKNPFCMPASLITCVRWHSSTWLSTAHPSSPSSCSVPGAMIRWSDWLTASEMLSHKR